MMRRIRKLCVPFTNGGNQDRILETIEVYAQNGNLVKTHVDEDDTLKQGIVDNLGRKLVS